MDTKTRGSAAIDWEQLKKKYQIVIEGNKATVAKRGWGKKISFTATAFLGTKAVDVLFEGLSIDLTAQEIFSKSNLESQLMMMCLFVAAEHEAAMAAVRYSDV